MCPFPPYSTYTLSWCWQYYSLLAKYFLLFLKIPKDHLTPIKPPHLESLIRTPVKQKSREDMNIYSVMSILHFTIFYLRYALPFPQYRVGIYQYSFLWFGVWQWWIKVTNNHKFSICRDINLDNGIHSIQLDKKDFKRIISEYKKCIKLK